MIKILRKYLIFSSVLVFIGIVFFSHWVQIHTGTQKIIFNFGRISHGASNVDDFHYYNYYYPAAPPNKINTEVVMFVPSPVQWEIRRKRVYLQFEKEGWKQEKAVLLFVFGNRTGVHLSETVNMSTVVKYPNAVNVVVNCRDFGDEWDNPDDSSGTTCKVYKSIQYIVANYNARYVWRGADDSYVNLPFFFRSFINTIPHSRLYLGSLRNPLRFPFGPDLVLPVNQPKLASLFGLYQFGQYMLGGGYMLSFDVAEFLASLKIPPHLTWCEDVMVGMWLNPFQVTFMHTSYYIEQFSVFNQALPGKDYLVIHYMNPEQWQKIDENGRLMT